MGDEVRKPSVDPQKFSPPAGSYFSENLTLNSFVRGLIVLKNLTKVQSGVFARSALYIREC